MIHYFCKWYDAAPLFLSAREAASVSARVNAAEPACGRGTQLIVNFCTPHTIHVNKAIDKIVLRRLVIMVLPLVIANYLSAAACVTISLLGVNGMPHFSSTSSEPAKKLALLLMWNFISH
jgi:hypothetical protein